MNIHIIIGPLCSGKTHLLKTDYVKYDTIDIGDIVRRLKPSDVRVFDQDLDQLIMMELRMSIIDAIESKTDLVIAGIRQLSILLGTETFIKAHQLNPKKKIKYSRFFLNTDITVRKERFESRKDSKDKTLTFSQADERDNKLGLKQLTNYCLVANSQNTIIKNT